MTGDRWQEREERLLKVVGQAQKQGEPPSSWSVAEAPTRVMRTAPSRTLRQTRLSVMLLALTLTACAAPSRYVFESGSAEDRAARYVAEWGGDASRYRDIFETGDCAMLAEFSVGPADADRDTPVGRAHTGEIEARRERMAELGCSEEPPPTPPW